MIIGAHVSAAGGISKAIDRGADIGAEAVQIFGSSTRSWRFKALTGAEAEDFRTKNADAGMSPPFLHAIYLINLGNANPDNVEKSVTSLVNYMRLADQIGAGGVIFHPGSHGGAGYDGVFQQVVDSIKLVLDQTPEGPLLCLENMAGMGQHIGAKFSELGEVLKAVDSPRLGICLDTQHAFAAGYDLTNPEGVAGMIEEFDRDIGLDRLAAVHANDSKRACGSGVDRHDNIGEGLIGEEGFTNIMSHPAFGEVPFFLEVPGFGEKRGGPDKPNVDILKAIRARVGG
jgi:deoxyribonuclease-4